MKFLIIMFCFLWVFDSLSQTGRMVVRRNCKYVQGVTPCSGSGERYWTGIQTYDYHDQTKSSAIWGPCYKKTIQNSGSPSQLIDTCTP